MFAVRERRKDHRASSRLRQTAGSDLVVLRMPRKQVALGVAHRVQGAEHYGLGQRAWLRGAGHRQAEASGVMPQTRRSDILAGRDAAGWIDRAVNDLRKQLYAAVEGELERLAAELRAELDQTCLASRRLTLEDVQFHFPHLNAGTASVTTGVVRAATGVTERLELPHHCRTGNQPPPNAVYCPFCGEQLRPTP